MQGAGHHRERGALPVTLPAGLVAIRIGRKAEVRRLSDSEAYPTPKRAAAMAAWPRLMPPSFAGTR